MSRELNVTYSLENVEIFISLKNYFFRVLDFSIMIKDLGRHWKQG